MVSKVIEVTSSEDVDKSTRAVMYFTRPHCAPCKSLGPLIEELSGEFEDVNFYRIDIEVVPELVLSEDIMSVPTVKLYKDGKEVNEFLGLRTKKEYVEALNSLV